MKEKYLTHDFTNSENNWQMAKDYVYVYGCVWVCNFCLLYIDTRAGGTFFLVALGCFYFIFYIQIPPMLLRSSQRQIIANKHHYKDLYSLDSGCVCELHHAMSRVLSHDYIKDLKYLLS